ncbi:MAG: hypothetical protein HOQ27_07170 [Dermatophilaceae bacterium]|nr:hypothetical protein [Dermatophilaceae bacterium]
MTAVLIGHGLGELLPRTGDHPFVRGVATLLDALPQIASSHDLVRPIDDVAKARSDEVRAFLEAHSPTADTEPGGGERWFAVEEPPPVVFDR